MFLNVAHVVEEQLVKTNLARSELIPLMRLLIGQPCHCRLALRTAIVEIVAKFVLCVDPLRKDARRVKLIKREGSGRSEVLCEAREVKVEPEETVVRDIPELLML